MINVPIGNIKLSLIFLLLGILDECAVFRHGSAVERNDPEKEHIVKVKFNFHFRCGPLTGADGRLLVYMQKSGKVGGLFAQYIELLDAVIAPVDNGHFVRNVDLPLTLGQPLNFNVLFRTQCYVLNRVGECCAHDFTFKAPIGAASKTVDPNSWVRSDFHRKDTAIAKCKQGMNGRNCQFTFESFNPEWQNGTIDLRELLLLRNKNYEKKWLDGDRFTSARRCSPRDDGYQWPEKTLKDRPAHKWPICAPPSYGLVNASYERETIAKLRDFDVVHAWINEGKTQNCPCYKPWDEKID